jgi:hypothetical protein
MATVERVPLGTGYIPHCAQSVLFSAAITVEREKVQMQSCVTINLGGFCSVFL